MNTIQWRIKQRIASLALPVTHGHAVNESSAAAMESGIDPDWDEAEEWIDKAFEDGVITQEWVISVGKQMKEMIHAYGARYLDEEGCSVEDKRRILGEIDGFDNEALATKRVCLELRAERRERNQ